MCLWQEVRHNRSLMYHVRSCNYMTCCGRRYANAQLLRRHKSIAHCDNVNVNVTVKTLSCKFCGKDNFTSARGRDAHTNRFCKRNPNSYLNLKNSELKSSSSTKEEKHAKKPLCKSSCDFTHGNLQQPPSSIEPKKPNLKLPFAAASAKWTLLEKKLKPLLNKQFPPAKIKNLDLDVLAETSAIFIVVQSLAY